MTPETLLLNAVCFLLRLVIDKRTAKRWALRLVRYARNWYAKRTRPPAPKMLPGHPVFVMPNYAAINEAYLSAHDEAVHAAIRASMRNNVALYAFRHPPSFSQGPAQFGPRLGGHCM
jgi:hypothetical protein